MTDQLRPLSPRSIVLSLLLGQHPPEMPVGRLLQFTSLFGIADGAVRTALSRLVAAGDLHTDGGRYTLSDRLLVRQAEQDAGLAAAPADWDGTWWFALVVAERRTVAERREFRSRAIGARLGELRPDTWLRPANVAVSLRADDVLLTRGPLVHGDGDELVTRLWDLAAIESRAHHLVDELDGVIGSLQAPVVDDRLPEAFTAMARAQRFLRAEPQLPAELSEHRSADVLRRRYDTAGRAFQAALRDFFTQHEPGVVTEGVRPLSELGRRGRPHPAGRGGSRRRG